MDHSVEPEPSQRRGTFLKGQQTRLALMQAAQKIFTREGFMNADIADIVAEAGKGKGTFYLYFDNKLHLLDAMIEAFAEELRSGQGLTARNPPEQIEAVLAAIWRTYKRHAATFRAIADAAAKHPDFAQKFRDLRAFALADFTAMVQSRQADGFCLELDAFYVAAALEQMVCHSISAWLSEESGVLADADAERRAFGALVAIMRAALALS